jgi:hypothetical protein
MSSDFADSVSSAGLPLSPYAPTHAPTPRSRRNLMLILLLFAFIGGIAAALWTAPALQKWWKGRETADGARDTGAPPLSRNGAEQPQAPLANTRPVTSLDVSTLEARLAALSARLDAISAQADSAGGNAARAEGLLIAFAARRTLDRGSPLGYLEGELRLRFGGAQPRAVSTIITAASTPVTLTDLQASLDDVAPALIGADGKQDWWTATRRELANLVIVRKAGRPSPVPQKAIEHAKLLLSAERVDNAVEEIERLPHHEGADEWLQKARQYNEARRALDVIEAAAILEPLTVPITARSTAQTNMQVAPPPPAVRTAPRKVAP